MRWCVKVVTSSQNEWTRLRGDKPATVAAVSGECEIQRRRCRKTRSERRLRSSFNICEARSKISEETQTSTKTHGVWDRCQWTQTTSAPTSVPIPIPKLLVILERCTVSGLKQGWHFCLEMIMLKLITQLKKKMKHFSPLRNNCFPDVLSSTGILDKMTQFTA